ncbi:MAG: MotA/TolQ/ExbB proton channel family protein [Phycisphaerales bacterium JB040]
MRNLATGLIVWCLASIPALAQGDTSAQATAGENVGGVGGVWNLFWQSFDLFSVVLIAGSLVAVAQITRVIMDVREPNISAPESTESFSKLLDTGAGPAEITRAAQDDPSFVAGVLAAAAEASPRGRSAMREAAEMEATRLASMWFRKIEILNVIGNLGPLVGLAGTVWGMVIAFDTLGASGGEAGPAQLSSGIAKALFHTLLGLVLAIPCLLTFGLYRGLIDRVCTRAMADGARLLERLPAGSTDREDA